MSESTICSVASIMMMCVSPRPQGTLVACLQVGAVRAPRCEAVLLWVGGYPMLLMALYVRQDAGFRNLAGND